MKPASSDHWQDWLCFLSQETETALWRFDIATQQPEFLSREYYLGYQPGDIAGSFEGWTSLLHPDEKNVIRRRLMEMIEGEVEHVRIEHRARHRNGSWHWMRTTIAIESRDSNNNPAVLLGTTVEITHPKHIERLLHLGRTMLGQLARPVPLTQMLEQLVQSTQEALAKGWVAVLLFDRTEIKWELAADTALPQPYRRLLSGEDSHRCTGDCLTTLNTTITTDHIDFNPWCEYCREAAKASGIRACNSLTLIGAKGEPLGRLLLYFTDPQTITQQEHEVLTTAALLAVVAIEHWRNQETLQCSQERFRLLAETVRVVPWEWSPQLLRYTYVGPQAVQIFEREQEEWMAPGFWENNIHPDEKRAILDQCESEFKTKDNYRLEYRFQKADGTWVWVHDIVTIQREAGKPVMLRGFMIDITDLRAAQERLHESEERLLSITNCAPDFIMLIDRVHRIQFINRLMSSFTMEKTLGTTVESWLHESDRLGSFRNIELAFLTGKSQQYETRYTSPNGEIFNFSTRVGPVQVGGKTESAVLIAHDVTALRRAEQALRERDSRLARAERLTTMGQMATELAHEINQPLYAIANFTDACNGVLQDMPGEKLAEVKHWLQQIGKQSRRASEIVRRIKNFVRKEEGEQTVFDVNDAVEKIVPLFEFVVRRDRVKLELDLTPNLPKTCADQLVIEQVVTNLMRNALESVRDAKTENGRVLVRSFRLTQDLVAVAVMDNGPGIDPEMMGSLFEPYVSTKADGSGLGLAICRTAIESLGGQIFGMNQPSGGAIFQFALPIHRPATDGDEQQPFLNGEPKE